LKRDHKRPNVESTFSMINKAKFGDSLRSRKDKALIDQTPCQVFRPNLGFLIQSIDELGISAALWEINQTSTEKAATESRDRRDFGSAGVGVFGQHALRMTDVVRQVAKQMSLTDSVEDVSSRKPKYGAVHSDASEI
jgi:hypothetical protein